MSTVPDPRPEAPRVTDAVRPNTPVPDTVAPLGLPTAPEVSGVSTAPFYGPGAAAGDFAAELERHPWLRTKWRLVRLLGSGGMGTVYLAEQSLLGSTRPVALKVINPSLMTGPEVLARFQAEVRAACQLGHANVVTVFDADQAGTLHFLVMEYVEGVSLAEHVKRNGPLAVGPACDVVSQAAAGLQHAHEKGMVHRDVKPANLMLTPSGLVKVLDFGLARLTKAPAGPHLTGSGAFMGTAAYVSPEQARDAGRADIRADVYSLGATLYCLLAGRPPFLGDSSLDLLMAHIERTPDPVHKHCPRAPEALSRLVARMLAKQPDDRPATPAEVVAALAPFRGNAPVASFPRTPPLPPTADGPDGGGTKTPPKDPRVPPPGKRSPARRRRRWAWPVAGVLAAAVVGGMAALLLGRAGPREVVPGREFVNGFGMKFVGIPEGEFVMGAFVNDPEAAADEKPAHRVKVAGFHLGAHEVTQAEYVAVTGKANPSWYSKDGGGATAVAGQDTGRFPVERVAHGDAVEFCKTLTEKDQKLPAGWSYSLPTEAEWEYACRAGGDTRFQGGDAFDDLKRSAWYGETSGGRPRAVGGAGPNAWGLYDMLGNVGEWCDDHFDREAYRKAALKKPRKPDARGGRVVRGGAWFSEAKHCRVTARMGQPAETRGDFGFRVALRREP